MLLVAGMVQFVRSFVRCGRVCSPRALVTASATNITLKQLLVFGIREKNNTRPPLCYLRVSRPWHSPAQPLLRHRLARLNRVDCRRLSFSSARGVFVFSCSFFCLLSPHTTGTGGGHRFDPASDSDRDRRASEHSGSSLMVSVVRAWFMLSNIVALACLFL